MIYPIESECKYFKLCGLQINSIVFLNALSTGVGDIGQQGRIFQD